MHINVKHLSDEILSKCGQSAALLYRNDLQNLSKCVKPLLKSELASGEMALATKKHKIRKEPMSEDHGSRSEFNTWVTDLVAGLGSQSLNS